MTTDAPASSRTKGFTTLFLIEMWERFGYYGMTAVVVLFMVQQLGYTDDRASLTFGAFAALAYTVPAIPNYPELLFPALAIVAVGGGIFKANPANMISNLYEGDSAKIDSAFTSRSKSVGTRHSRSARRVSSLAFSTTWR